MKKLTVTFILSLIVFVSCDKVKNPVIPKKCNLSQIHVVDSNSSVIDIRKVMVQDYTGHTCGNCPRAAEDLENISATHPGKVIGIAVHAGTQFSPPKLPDFPEDFRTTVGSQWDVEFGMSAAGLPKGTVNWATQPYAQPRSSWASQVNTQLASAQKAKIFLKTSLDTVEMAFGVDVKVTMLTATNFDVRLVLVVTEDSIVARQKDYNPPVGALVENGDEIPDYVFMHVLRRDVNGTWGDLLKEGPVSSGFQISKTYCSNVSPWGGLRKNLKHTSVVAILYTKDAGSGAVKEVLQIEKLHLMK
ncbi:MAG: Omp28-related outer membrane protein [Bacteroidia bacterium]|nr:Omp28-related outer membrane protein [Bacteroidia bacterium]